MDWKLRKDPRIELHERFNVRYLEASDVPEKVDLVVIDLSFISLRLILPRLKAFPRAQILALVKPQFEARKDELQRGGLIADPVQVAEIVGRVIAFANQVGFRLQAQAPSQVRGRKGNREYFLLLQVDR